MDLVDSVRVAVRALNANKMRSGLTMLGVIIGVAAVIALLSIGQGVQRVVTEQIQSAGANLLFVLPVSVEEGGGGEYTASLTYDDVELIADRANVPDVSAIAPMVSGSMRVARRTEEVRTTVAGVSSDYNLVRNFEVVLGRFITSQDEDRRARVAVLGADAAEDLFEEYSYPVGETIKVDGIPFRVVGVLEGKGAGFMGNEDGYVYVPISTAHARLFSQQRNLAGQFQVSTIYVQVASEDRMDAATEDINGLLRASHDISLGEEDDFAVINQADLVDIMAEVTGILTLFLGAIAAISLLVGGIGIMNIMLVSVTERTREVGIRKAVGAKRRDILLQFLVEAMVLSLIGGAAGILVGYSLSRGISRLSQDLVTVVSINSVVLATTFSLGVGVIFGLYPALRAARLNPIDALRYE